MRLSILILLMALPAVSGFARDYKLTEKGKTDARIQMNQHPSAPEFRAAKEIQDYVKKISGIEMPSAVNPSIYELINGNIVEILLVTLENGKYLMPAQMKEKLSKTSNEQAFYIRTEGGRIIIGGKKPIGVLYGTYTFIEKYLGVRWFHPGADGEYCPKSQDITVGEIDDFEEPSINGRFINYWDMTAKPWTMEEVRVWQIRNKMQFRYHAGIMTREGLDLFECGNSFIQRGGHSTFEQAVPKELFETHPEYFPLVNGKRICEKNSQRCLANPDVRKMVADYAREMTKYGGEYMVSFNDATFSRGSWCQCPECMKMGTYEGKFTVSNLAHRFTSMISNEILKLNPDARLSIEIYSEFRDPPTDPSIRYDHRVLGRYCPHQRCYVHRLDDAMCECNTRFYKYLLAWLKACPKMELYDFTACAKSPYAPMEYTLAEDIKLYGKLNLESWIDDCTDRDQSISNYWTFYYVAAKMLWDSSLDVDKLMSEAYDKYYGQASVPMKKYQALRRELWEQAPGHAFLGGPTRIAYCLTVPGSEKRLKGYLDEADKLAGNDAVLKRRIAADRGRLEQFWVKEAEKIKKIMAGQNNVPVQEAHGKMTIDGNLNEEAWKKAQLITGFLTVSGEGVVGEPAEETRVKVLYDKDNWYLGFEAMTEHAWSPLKTDVRKHDGEVWTDDFVEIFLVTPDGGCFQWAINSAGVFYDAKGREADFESNAEIKTNALKDRYVVEARIPSNSMGVKIADGQVWKMQFSRVCRNLQPPKTVEESFLDGVSSPDPGMFRRATVGRSAIRNGNFEEIATDEKTGIRFPKGWGGNKAVIIEGKNNKNRIELKDVFYIYMGIPSSEHGNVLAGAVTASGKGTMTVWTSTCVRPPGDKRPWSAELKHENPPFELTDSPKAHQFKFEFVPYEDGSIYFRVNGGNALIDGINAARTEAP